MVRLVLTDLDGTLVTSKKELTEATRDAVRNLSRVGIGFTLVSGRPPLGLRFLARALDLRIPFAAFSGGMLLNPDLSVLEELTLDPEVVVLMLQRLSELGLEPWLYQGHEWLIRNPNAPHVAEERDTVRFNPTVVTSFDNYHERIVKIVGVSDDHALVEHAETDIRGRYVRQVTAARSQNYYLDITHPGANKGAVFLRLAELLNLSASEIATLGDMPSDVAMFSQSRISFAMGNASDSVKARATYVVASNDNDGFAEAASKILASELLMTERNQNSPLVELYSKFGQSPWLDFIDRDLITNGGLDQLIVRQGIRGLTSNPSIFERAMAHSGAYDAQIDELLAQGDWEVKALYEELATSDIRAAADLLKPVYGESLCLDGLASFEVAPAFARDTQRTIAEARRLWKNLDRPNVMIKVPGTEQGLPAIRQLIADGININITLLFSRAMYRRVAEAYLEGLEERIQAGKPVDHIVSVASFFVSRIDTLADQELGKLTHPDAKHLMGKVAIANAKLAYVFYREFTETQRWKAVARAGAHPQRLLWASTSTKNPAFRDVLYVEQLIGHDTVNTMPPSTMKAFEDHGVARETLTSDIDGARQTLARLAELGISLESITDRLTEDAIRLFSEPFDNLMASLERKKRRRTPNGINPLFLHLPIKEMTLVGETLRDWGAKSGTRRLWNRDSSLWTGHDEAKWLGWLTAVDAAISHIPELRRHRSECLAANVKELVLLGMGGSSLAPEVFQMTFDPPDNRPDLHILDSTDPGQISRLEALIDPARTLFIVSSKSGTTLEPNIFFDYFYAKVRATLGDNAGSRFIAITDPGSPLERLAQEKGFFRVIHGNVEIGGRYSALSAFGLAPAAMMGVDIERFLKRAEQMAHSCSENVPPEENPGVILGATLAALGKSGRDKITFICSPEIEDISAWLEQLLAESTGKLGRGLIPVSEEKLGTPESYGDDRVFVYLRLEGSQFTELDRGVSALETFGHPVVKVEVEGAYTLGQEFFRWELATAVAGSILGIDPFDQPDVETSKIATRRLTSEIEKSGALPKEEPLPGEEELSRLLRAHFSQIRRHDYFALLAYVEMNQKNEEVLQDIREMIRGTYRVATCLGFGPRFLHSTGQAYKGGTNSGVFLQITSDHDRDLPIPGHAFTFGQVQAAQASGDFQVLAERHRRCLKVHLPAAQLAGLRRLQRAVRLALAAPLGKGVAA